MLQAFQKIYMTMISCGPGTGLHMLSPLDKLQDYVWEAACTAIIITRARMRSKGFALGLDYIVSSLAGHTLSQERVWYFTMQRFVPDPRTFVGCFPPNVYVVCVLRDRVYTLQPLSARTISCTVMYQTLS